MTRPHHAPSHCVAGTAYILALSAFPKECPNTCDRNRESIMILLTMGLISLSKPGINFKIIKSAFQIPHHVALRILVCAPPRCFSAENSGAGGGGFWHCAKNQNNKVWSFPRSCAKVEPYSRFVWANSVKGIPPIVDLGRANHYRLAVPVTCRYTKKRAA